MRTYEITRTTAETDISLSLNLDGTGKSTIDTGCGFLNHMLTLFASHGRFDLNVTCKGDVDVKAVKAYILVNRSVLCCCIKYITKKCFCLICI